jgi:hypothetical protein
MGAAKHLLDLVFFAYFSREVLEKHNYERNFYLLLTISFASLETLSQGSNEKSGAS